MASTNPARITVGPVRLSFPNLFEPRAQDQEGKGDPKYSAAIMIRNDDKRSLDLIQRATEEALKIGVEKSLFKQTAVDKGLIDSTLRDGEEKSDERPEYEGMQFMNVRSKNKPTVIDSSKNKIEDKDDERVFPGAWAYVSLSAFPFSNNGNKGVSFGLGNVMIVPAPAGQPDDRLGGGGASASTDFEDIEATEVSLDDDEGLL